MPTSMHSPNPNLLPRFLMVSISKLLNIPIAVELFAPHQDIKNTNPLYTREHVMTTS